MTDTNVSTKDKPGDYDAIETLKPGEPVFPIQGGDPLGPKTVQFWADSARELARTLDNDKQRESLMRKATMAEHVGWAMTEYQAGHQPVAGGRASYNEHVEASGPDLAERIAIRRALIDGARAIHNAVGIVKEVEETLARIGVHPDEQAKILDLIAGLQAVAAVVEPRRGNEQS
jgi:hypothetical protein